MIGKVYLFLVGFGYLLAGCLSKFCLTKIRKCRCRSFLIVC